MELPTPFRVDVSRDGGTLVVAPVGEIDLATREQLREALRPEEPAARVVLDLSEVSFMDTSGLGLVVEEMRGAGDAGREFILVRGPRPVQRLLDIAGLTPLLRLVDSREDALDGGRADQA